MDENFVKEEMFKLFETVLKIDAQNKHERSEITEWDSLKHIDIIFAIEDRFKIQFTPEEMTDLDSIDRAIKLVEYKNKRLLND